MPELIVIQPATRPRVSAWKPVVTRLYRLGVLVAILWLMRAQHTRLRVEGSDPIRLEETRSLFPAAAKLEPDSSERLGLFVLDREGKRIGYVLRTSPVSDKIIGYCGPTDTLVGLTPDKDNPTVVGIKIRHSGDTEQHVADVADDEDFMGKWNGKTWDQVAGMEPRKAKIEGVSGASMTSMSIATGIHRRFDLSKEAGRAEAERVKHWPRFHGADVGIVLVMLGALALSFSHLRSVVWVRRAFQLVLIGYLGLINGQLLAQSLLAGWAFTAIPWQAAPGLTLLAAAALVMPWTTRRQLYCSQICPHGAAQELVGRLGHRFSKRPVSMPRSLDRGLRWLPPLLIGLVVVVTMQVVPFNLAGIEPFDAYVVRSAGAATIAVALVGLVAAMFIPMAYCKYGCPTGAVLSFVRSHGKADGFGRRDLAGGAMVLLTFVLYVWNAPIHHWLIGPR